MGLSRPIRVGSELAAWVAAATLWAPLRQETPGGRDRGPGAPRCPNGSRPPAVAGGRPRVPRGLAPSPAGHPGPRKAGEGTLRRATITARVAPCLRSQPAVAPAPPGGAVPPVGTRPSRGDVRNRPGRRPVGRDVMADTPRPSAPSGLDDLTVRERWLHQRRAHDFASRRSGLIALWVTVAAVVAWLFIAGFAGMGH